MSTTSTPTGAESTPCTEVRVKLSGLEKNAIVIMGTVWQTLRRAGHADLANTFLEEVQNFDYDTVLARCSGYVHVD